MSKLCYICKIEEVVVESCCQELLPEEELCIECHYILRDNLNELLAIQNDSYEFNPMTILRDVPRNKKKSALEKILKILSLPEYFVFQELKQKTRNVDSVCKNCPYYDLLFEYYRIVEDKDDFLVMCRHKARNLTTHKICNFCGVRYFNNGVIAKNGKNIASESGKKKFKCYLCIEKKKIVDSIT
jgi:hypothetical protein